MRTKHRKLLKKTTAAVLFVFLFLSTIFANLPFAYARDLQAGDAAGDASAAPSAEPEPQPEASADAQPSAEQSSEPQPEEPSVSPELSAEPEEGEPSPSVSAEPEEPSPSASEEILFEHVPEIIIPKPRTMLYSNISGFPASYRGKLQALQNKYPNWVFIPVMTNLNWNTVIAEESKSNRCTIQQSANETLKDPAPGTYDPGWQKASKQADAYFIDPRNFLTEQRIYQFEQLSFNASVHTQGGVESVMAGTFMANKNISYYRADGQQVQTDKRYSQAVLEAGYTSGLSPYYIVSKIKQEVGTAGTSGSISGRYPGYEGLYNYFNIGANDGGNNIANGLFYAKGGSANLTTYNRPWTDPMRAITGGAKNVAERFVNKGQDTVYFQRFNVKPGSSYSHYTHQYMTNVAGAAAEAYNTYTAYKGAGQLASAKSFLIPVYNNMPNPETGVTITTAKHTGVVNASGVNVRKGPATSYGSVGVQLTPSDKFQILGGSRNDLEYTSSFLTYPYWVQVRFTKNGKTYEGYIYSNYCQPDSERNLYIGDTYTLGYTTGTTEKVYFESTNSKVATVSDTGTVTAVGKGTAIIRAYTSSGNHMDLTMVTVVGDKLPTPEVRFVQARVRNGQFQHVFNWKSISGAAGYEIYTSLSENGNYTLAADNPVPNWENYVRGETEGVVRFYKVRAYRIANGQKYYSEFSAPVSNIPSVQIRFTQDRVRDGDYQYVINWISLPRASGYEVYSSITENGPFALEVDNPVPGWENFVAKRQTQGIPKYYKIRPYEVIAELGLKSYGAFTDVQMLGQATNTPELLYIQVPDSSDRHNVTWKAVSGAEGYEIHAASSENGTYRLVGSASGGKATVYSNAASRSTVTYYKIRAYRVVDGVRRYSRYSQVRKNLPALEVRFGQDRVRDGDYQYVLNWKSISGINGYEVYAAYRSSGPFKLLTTSTDPGWENLVDKNQTQGIPKYYKVRPYQNVGGVRVYGGFTQVQKIGTDQKLPVPKTRFVQTRVRDGKFQHVFNWKSVSGATGYEIYTSLSENGNYTLTAENAVSGWENYVRDETEGVVRYYKVRAYWLRDGIRFYSDFSEVRSNLSALTIRFGQDRVRDGDYQYVLNWISDPRAAGYEVYSALSEDGPFTLAVDNPVAGWENFVDKKQTQGVPKYYKVRPYEIINGSKSYGAFSKVQKIGMETAPAAPETRFVQTRVRDGKFQHVFNWKAVSGADGYEIYTSLSENGNYTLAAKNAVPNWENYVRDETEGVVRYYKVRAYRVVGGTTLYGDFSEVRSNLSALTVRFGQDRVRDGDYQYVLNWISDPRAAGYEVYSALSEDGPFTLAVDNPVAGWENFVDKKQTQGVAKYYKVRPYEIINGSKSYGAFSKVQKIGEAKALSVPEVRFVQTRVRNGKFQHVFNWKAVSGADGYEIYTSLSESGPFALTAENAVPSWENYVRDETEGVVRYYKVRAYWLGNGTRFYSDFSEVKSNLSALTIRFGQDRVRDGDYQYVLNWISDPRAAGYEVYSALSEDGPFTLAVDNPVAGWENFVDKKQTQGVPKYYKVRPYEITNGSKSYGAFSKVQKIG